MTDQIKTIVSASTKRKRKVTGVKVENTVKARLNQNINSQIIYEGNTDEDLKIVRKKLHHDKESNLQIRGNKIFAIKRRLTKMELIQKTITETIEIMNEKHLITNVLNADELSKVVYNKFIGGTERKLFILSKKNNL